MRPFLIQQGASVKAVQMQSGHSSPTVTLATYTHLFEGDIDHLYDRVDEAHSDRLAAYPRPERGLGVAEVSELRVENRP